MVTITEHKSTLFQGFVQANAPAAGEGGHPLAIGDLWEDNVSPFALNRLTATSPVTWVSIEHTEAHNVLASAHSDSLAGTVVRGDVIRGNSTPAWSRLAVGAANTFLASDGTDVAYRPLNIPISMGVSERGVNLAVTTGTHRFYFRGAGTPTWTIVAVWTSVGVAPAGAAILVDVNINGTTIFTTQGNRPSIADGGNASSRVTNMDVTSIANGDYITVDIDQVGSTTAGQDLHVQLEVVRTA